ncbi:MAG: lysophospholipase [Lachnospiraceae bacterium]|nr:lysophospholipase [Lachnospiraceae bacterium]
MEQCLYSDTITTLSGLAREQYIRLINYQELNKTAQKGQILFTGSSLMEQFPINELSISHNLGKIVYNRGIGGYKTDDFLQHIDTMLFDLEPSKVFLNIGTNDMNEREDGENWQSHLMSNYRKILDLCKENLPGTPVYIMAFYPVNPVIPAAQPLLSNMLKIRTMDNLSLANRAIAELAASYGYQYIDANQGLTDDNGNLKAEFTVEGVHMFADAYEIVYRNLLPYL